MSKALLKKSLVFVKEGSSDDGRKVGDRKGEGKKRADLKLPLSNLVASEKSYKKRRPNRSSFSSKSTVEASFELNLKYFKKRKRISAKTIKRVAQYGRRKRVKVETTPTNHTARKIRTRPSKVQGRVKQRSQFSILNIPGMSQTTGHRRRRTK